MLHDFEARRLEDLAVHAMAGVKIIAVIGDIKDWAAYKGLTNWSDERVAAEGDKIPQDAAELLFDTPVRLGLHYRS
jgi:hypothetical protein